MSSIVYEDLMNKDVSDCLQRFDVECWNIWIMFLRVAWPIGVSNFPQRHIGKWRLWYFFRDLKINVSLKIKVKSLKYVDYIK